MSRGKCIYCTDLVVKLQRKILIYMDDGAQSFHGRGYTWYMVRKMGAPMICEMNTAHEIECIKIVLGMNTAGQKVSNVLVVVLGVLLV